MSKIKCVLCKILVNRLSNAEPVIEGQCCDMCNTLIVIPARLRESGASEVVVSNYLNSQLTPTPEEPEKLPLVGTTTKTLTCPNCKFEFQVDGSMRNYDKYASYVDYMNATFNRKKAGQYARRGRRMA